MKLFNGITRFFYTLILILLGACLILVALNFIPKESLINIINLIYLKPDLRIITGFAGLLLIGVSLLIIQIAIGRMEREKIIAFENPDGQVTVSLAAIEDFMRRLARQVPEIKELRPKVTATKKGIIVDAKVTLYSEISIPNITEKIQSIVKNRVQDMLGIEEAIIVKVHINKLAQREEPKKKKSKREKQEEQEEEPKYRGIEYSEE
ncbi:MAG: alkaline shock response membrane anchor protein AmaP [Candidatus Omnitrophica bacterium]|nr:alkaline shock response membrane anchor protein AmaP [Candidatus Omnitrophota bacterium]